MKKSKTRNVKRKGGSQQRMVRHVKVKTPSQTITVKLTKEQTEAIEDAYFNEALPECTVMTDQKGKTLYLCVTHPDHDGKPELKINLDKELRHLASGNWMANDYEQLAAMVKSFGRTYDFLKRYLKTWGACKVCDGEIPHGHMNNCDIYKLECKIAELTSLLEVTRHYRIGHEVPLEWFIKRDKAIGNPAVSPPNGQS